MWELLRTPKEIALKINAMTASYKLCRLFYPFSATEATQHHEDIPGLSHPFSASVKVCLCRLHSHLI